MLKTKSESDSNVVTSLTQEMRTVQLQIETRNKEAEGLRSEIELLRKEISDRDQKFFDLGFAVRRQFESVLRDEGAELQGLVLKGERYEMSSYFGWLKTEIGLLPGVIDKATNFAAIKSTEALIDMLEKRGCDHWHFLKHKGQAVSAGIGESVSGAINTAALRLPIDYWKAIGRSATKKTASDRLAQFFLGKAREERRAKLAAAASRSQAQRGSGRGGEKSTAAAVIAAGSLTDAVARDKLPSSQVPRDGPAHVIFPRKFMDNELCVTGSSWARFLRDEPDGRFDVFSKNAKMQFQRGSEELLSYFSMNFLVPKVPETIFLEPKTANFEFEENPDFHCAFNIRRAGDAEVGRFVELDFDE
ncbi:hypothetical protein EJB05_00272 [Eragrostis curvula]|uniref:Uncharacterized protein n=1 Tax=Eragrostis curvula TaxID=38414 RepID=A0A5J9WLM1_9POAL|nr:hypothetical protein EJB05_00272 [Eragrostis curvula]